ncbi:MAG: chloride channel protein [Methanobrevibacter sp.]|uniref:chloride channel protein n=1 Tax=Methanobrevibacter sp. TaxID=66852 RepID=UPI0026E091D8|nr:chloride channel protein [Methanobrevibacter sp.]MDO5848441.1 chloride channel protein [Methanobrevibacter sp.]
MGCIFAIIVWLFLKTMNIGTNLLWNILPNFSGLKIYPIITCLIGGLILGLVKMKYGETIYEMDVLIKKVKNKEKLKSENIIVIFISALIPIIFGGSIGPEAGLCCIIIILCIWISKYMAFFNKNVYEICDAGINSVFTLIFLAPLYGLVAPIENEINTKKKMYSNLICIFGALLVFYALGQIFGLSGGFPHVENYNITNFERMMAIPMAIIGSAFGIIYLFFDKFTLKLFEKISFKYDILVTCLIGGLILGICGTFLPLTLFSGQENMEIILQTYASYTPLLLIVIGLIKLLLTNICIKSGWKGGPFFPVIFSGIIIGCGLSLLFNVNVGFSVAIIVASMLGVLMKKPIAVALLLLLCFDLSIIPWLIAASFIGTIIPTDKLNLTTKDFENSV